MRIIAGEFRGLKLTAPKGDAIRPTADRIKEDVFNIIRPYIYENSVFLDLFAGTGSMGIEAVSRGAAQSVLVDMSMDSLSSIKQNTDKLKCPQRFRTVRSEAKKFLIETRARYDIIFMDPPYAYDSIGRLMDIIGEKKLLAEDGILITEQGVNDTPESSHFELIRRKKYAVASVCYYKYKHNEA